jgi:type IV secretion system protein VirB10
MTLISPLRTTSATPGSGVYLETMFPVVQNDRIVIPAHTRVIGTVADGKRPGRIRGRAQMRLRFTQLILSDNRVLPIAANLQSVPGSSRNRTVDHEGTIEPVDQIDADVYTVATTTGAGVLVGSIRHVGIGVGPGALIGAGLGFAKVLFSRGDEIFLPVGTRVEMVLQHPLSVRPASFSTPSTAAVDAEAAIEQQAASRERPVRAPGENMPCLREGVTLRCVASIVLKPAQAKPAPSAIANEPDDSAGNP